MGRSFDTDTLRSALLAWYDANRRDLPWRYSGKEVPDPYRVWLSEVMLQQTRVDTVKPYFRRWLDRFPTLSALAEAPLDDVLKAWEGLGYYSRARNFHAAVREVACEYGGAVPDDPAAFRALPGVGEYTAGAVMSIAFGKPAPAVDGNVRRVISRLLDDAEPSAKVLRAMASGLAEGERPGDLNQALMELGATVCTPRRPACDACPVSSFCRARAAGSQEMRPARRKRLPLPVEEVGVGLLPVEGRFLVVRRPDGGRLAGLWEFPSGVAATRDDVAPAAAEAVLEVCGARVSVDARLGVVRHDFSHVRVFYHVFGMRLDAPFRHRPDEDGDRVRWLRLEELDSVTLPTAQQKIARMAAAVAG